MCIKTTAINCIGKLSRWMIVGCITLLAGCSNSPLKRDMEELTVIVSTDKNSNLNEKGQPAPLNVAFYTLTSVDLFENSDFFAFSEATKSEVLKSSKEIYEGIFQPGEERKITISPEKEAIAIGVVAAYRDIDNVDWSDDCLIDEIQKQKNWWHRMITRKTVELHVLISPQAITINKNGLRCENK